MKAIINTMLIITLFAILNTIYIIHQRNNLIEIQKQEIARLETKIIFLENNDWALAVQNMPEMERYELKALNEQIKQKKYKENNANR